MSDELIKELRIRISELQSELGKVKDESIDRRTKLRDANKAKADYEAKITALMTERDSIAAEKTTLEADYEKRITAIAAEKTMLDAEVGQWKTKATAAPGEQALRITELESQIRERDHRDAWSKALNGNIQDKVTVADIWAKAEYKAEGETPTEDQIKELVGKARDAAPYLFRAEGETPAGVPGGTKAVERAPLKVTEPPSRGVRDSTAGRITYHKHDIAIAGWERRNPSLAKALSEHNAVCLDAE